MSYRTHEGPSSEGLLVSLLIYVSAVLGVLALVAVPVWRGIGPTVMQNVSPQRVHQMLAVRRSAAFPVARLVEPDIVDPVHVAELTPRAREPGTARRHRAEIARRAAAPRRAREAAGAGFERSYAEVTPQRTPGSSRRGSVSIF